MLLQTARLSRRVERAKHVARFNVKHFGAAYVPVGQATCHRAHTAAAANKVTQRKATRLLLKDTLSGIQFPCAERVREPKPQLPTQEPTQASSTAEGSVVQVDFQTFCARLENVRKYSMRANSEKIFLKKNQNSYQDRQKHEANGHFV